MTEETIGFSAYPVKTSQPIAAGPLDSSLSTTLVGVALILGLLGNTLVFPEALGLGATIWCLAVLGAMGLFHWKESSADFFRVLPIYVLATIAAVGLSWRDAPFLRYGNLALFFFVVAWIQLAHTGLRFRQIPIVLFLYHVGGVVLAWLCVPFLQSRLSYDASPELPKNSMRPLFHGVLFAGVGLAVFGTLLASADERFGALLRGAFVPGDATWLRNLVWSLIFAAVALSIITNRARAWGHWTAEMESAEGRLQTLRHQLVALEVLLPMVALNLLFAVFVFMQLGYLFGGESYVQESMGVTYADYARRGFFELATVAALILPMQLFFDWLLREATPAVRRTYHYLAFVQALLLLCILVSAAHRMALYQSVYGLTQLRFYASAGILWIGLCVVWHQITVWRAQRESVVIGSLAAALTLFFVIQLMNPDAFIARKNLDRILGNDFEVVGHESGTINRRTTAWVRLDVDYLRELSLDSVPTAIRMLSGDDVREERALERILSERNPHGEIRTWNWGRWRAASAMLLG